MRKESILPIFSFKCPKGGEFLSGPGDWVGLFQNMYTSHLQFIYECIYTRKPEMNVANQN